jgi:ADP-ribosyl-[dinitrogen reductase] hydrolase
MIKIATLVGCAIGDALGNPFEMKPASSPALKEWDGLFKAGGTFWKGEAGQYTDDTLMSMALTASLIERSGFEPANVAENYLAWYDSGNTRGIGTTTANAIVNLKMGATWQESGLKRSIDGLPAGGNGTAMRASPIGLWYRKDPEKLLESAMLDASITHNSFEPKMGSVAVALATAMLANGTATPQDVCWQITDIVNDSVVKEKLLLAQKWLEQGTPLDTIVEEALAEIGVSGYVPETVGAAFFCLGATDNFKDAVVMAVKAGGDTDTTAAIVGALAGTYYGLENIPSEYTETVENFELLQGLTDILANNGI